MVLTSVSISVMTKTSRMGMVAHLTARLRKDGSAVEVLPRRETNVLKFVVMALISANSSAMMAIT